MAWLSTDTDMEWQRCFLLSVISQDRSQQSVTHNAQRLAGGLFIAAGVFAHVFPQQTFSCCTRWSLSEEWAAGSDETLVSAAAVAAGV